MDIVIAVDGSDNALEAVRYGVKLSATNPEIRLHLLNVQPPLPSAVSSFVSKEAVRSFHQEEGEKCLKSARELLTTQKIAHESHVAVGNAAEAIVAYGKEKGCETILMGTRGLSVLPSLLLGSVATRVLHLAEVPVILVPRKRRA
ncbi:MAG TPA: universal stress protein [Alphaproteobacteria bacterium]|nr:universal stress protein [Alphaproteobacteria bacterium]